MIDITRPPATRIFGIVARNAPRVLILRRGPSKQVLAVMWYTQSHEFYAGQWLKGRIYERSCDLSPSGERFIFAATQSRGGYQQWTAVSRPPFLTAIALWRGGEAWGGGGVFDTENRIRLNHGGLEEPDPALRPPRKVVVEPYRPSGGREPIDIALAMRNGWVIRQPGKWARREGQWPKWRELTEPAIWHKRRQSWTIEARVVAYGEPGDPYYLTEHRILDRNGKAALSLGRSDWCDWSFDGQVLFGREGRLYRVAMSARSGPREPEELIDLRRLRFEPVAPPDAATQWTGEVCGRRIR